MPVTPARPVRNAATASLTKPSLVGPGEVDAEARLAARRDELLLAGRLERFDENRNRYDERSTRFQEERRAPDSERTERYLANLFVTNELSDLLAGVDCRETLCRLTIESSEDAVGTILRMGPVLTPLGKDRALRGERSERTQGTRYVIYVERDMPPSSG